MSSGDLFKPDLLKNQMIQSQRSPETGLHRHGYKMIRIYECSYLTLGWRVNNWSITSHQRRTCGLTLLLPPPGTCLMLSIDPIFDWALNSSFSDMISTFPPPWKGRSNSSWFHSIKCRIISIKSKVRVVVCYVKSKGHDLPGLWRMLPFDPHFDCTLPRSIFLWRIWTFSEQNTRVFIILPGRQIYTRKTNTLV